MGLSRRQFEHHDRLQQSAGYQRHRRLVSLNSGTAATDSNVLVYGNVFWWTDRYGASAYGDGIVACINGNNCPGWVVYNNTIAGMTHSLNAGVIWSTGTSGTPMVENNLWCDINGASTKVTIAGTNDYNTFSNVDNDPGGGSHNYYAASGSANPFVSSTDFRLSSETVGLHLNDGASLPSPYDTDPDGRARGSDGTWERGAYEYGGQGPRPAPPTALTATVH